jgi:hypothetical protein
MSHDSTIVSMSPQDAPWGNVPPEVDEFIRAHEPEWDAMHRAAEHPETRVSAACAILAIGVAAMDLSRDADGWVERFCFRRIASVAFRSAGRIIGNAP